MQKTPRTYNDYNKITASNQEEIDSRKSELIWKKIIESGQDKNRKLF